MVKNTKKFLNSMFGEDVKNVLLQHKSKSLKLVNIILTDETFNGFEVLRLALDSAHYILFDFGDVIEVSRVNNFSQFF